MNLFTTPMDNHKKLLGEESIRLFSFTLARLFNTEKFQYDILLACGNTGIYMAELTNMTLKLLSHGQELPILPVPIQRFRSLEAQTEFDQSCTKGAKHLSYQLNPTKFLPRIIFDNSVLIPSLKKKVNGKKFKNFLFVDDEIHSSLTIRLTIDILKKLDAVLPFCNLTIIAENHNLIWPYHDVNVFLHFLPFGLDKSIPNLVTKAISNKSEMRLRSVLKRYKLTNKEYCNLLLNLPVKSFNKKKPCFTGKFQKILKAKLLNFDILCDEHKKHINKLLCQGLKRYHAGCHSPAKTKCKLRN